MSGRDDYIEVGERLQEFYSKFPDGSLQVIARELVELPGMGWWWIVEARAYRTPDDPRPGIGLAQEAVPGRTQFTRGSELMNAETSAWGRAMAALGIATKKGIATGHEVRMARSRQQDEQYAQTKPVTRQKASPDDPANEPYQTRPPGPPPRPVALSERPDVGAPKRLASEKSTKMMWALLRKTGMTDDQTRDWVAHVLGIGPDWHTDSLDQFSVSTIIDRLKQEAPDAG